MIIASFLVYNWSSVVRLQIQVQNEADAAAQLAVLPQVTQFNQLSLGLYAANVEEYRLRTLMQALILNVQDSAGCDYPSNGKWPTPEEDNITQLPQTQPAALNCRLNYPRLRQAYIDSTNRYTDNVRLIESVGHISVAEQQKAPVRMITALQAACGAGCGTHYLLNVYTARERVKSLGKLSTDAISYNFDGANKSGNSVPNPILTPMTADVTVCMNVTSLLPSIFGKTFGPVRIVARSAATPIATTQEWFEPGLALDPKSSNPLQGQESWTDIATLDRFGKNWNMVNFSGNFATADAAKQNYATNISNTSGELAVFLAWWNSSLVHPVKLDGGEQAALKQQLEAVQCGG